MLLLQPYLKGNMGQTDVQGSQEIGKTGFFAFLKDYWKDPEGFGVSHARRSSGEITLTAEAEIRRELPRKKKLIEVLGCSSRATT